MEKPEIVTQLKADLEAWNQTLIDPTWPRVMDFEFVDGQAVYYFPL